MYKIVIKYTKLLTIPKTISSDTTNEIWLYVYQHVVFCFSYPHINITNNKQKNLINKKYIVWELATQYFFIIKKIS